MSELPSGDNSRFSGSRSVSAIVVLLIVCAALGLLLYRFNVPATRNAPVPAVAATTELPLLAVVPLSGKGASHGEYVREGLRMFEQAHPNSPVRVTIIDSESDPAKAVSGYEQQMLLRKPKASISVLSKVSDTVAPLAEKNKTLLIGVNTATDTFVNNYSQTQRINDRPLNHTAPLARFAARKFSHVAVVYSNESFGLFCKTTFESEFRKLNSGGRLTLEPYNMEDLNQNIVVQRVLSGKPDAVYVAGYGQAYISIFQNMRTFRYDGMVLADINFSNPQVLAALGDAAEGVVFAAMGFNVSPPPTPESAKFLADYQRLFKRDPWLGSAFAYDALAIVDHLYRQKQPLNRNSIFALKQWPGIAARLSFPSPGECQYQFEFVQRTNGKNRPIALATFDR